MGGLKHVASTLRPLAKGLSRALKDNPVASSLCLGCASGCVAKAMARACVSTYASRAPGDGVRI